MWKNIITQGLLQIIILGTILFKGKFLSNFRSRTFRNSIVNRNQGRRLERSIRKALLNFLQHFCVIADFQWSECQKAKIKRIERIQELLQQPTVFGDFGVDSRHPNVVRGIRWSITEDSPIDPTGAFYLFGIGISFYFCRILLQTFGANQFVQLLVKGK